MIENCGLCIGVGIAITLIGLWPLAIFIRYINFVYYNKKINLTSKFDIK